MILPCSFGFIWTHLKSLHDLCLHLSFDTFPQVFPELNHFLNQSHLFVDNILKYLSSAPLGVRVYV